MKRSVFDVPRMDCPSEERMIRLALNDVEGIATLKFDLPARSVSVEHEADEHAILTALSPLGLGVQLRSSTTVEGPAVQAQSTLSSRPCSISCSG